MKQDYWSVNQKKNNANKTTEVFFFLNVSFLDKLHIWVKKVN